MAKLKTIQAYRLEIMKLHQAGDSLPTTILAKLLSTLEERVKSVKSGSKHFTRSFPSRQECIYDECSALWIAFAGYYHSVSFTAADTLQDAFQAIWKSFRKDYGRIAPAICQQDFFRKCLIAAELYRRKQYTDYVKSWLLVDAPDTLEQDRMFDKIERLPSFPLSSESLTWITEKLFTLMMTTREFTIFNPDSEKLADVLGLLCIANHSIEDFVTRAIQFLDSAPDRSKQGHLYVRKFIERQEKMPGGVQLTDEQLVIIGPISQIPSPIRPSNSRFFSDLTKMMNPPTDKDILSHLPLIKSENHQARNKAFSMIDERYISPALLPTIINHLLEATKDEKLAITRAAYAKLRALPIPAELNERVVNTLLEPQAKPHDIYSTARTPLLGRTVITKDILPNVINRLLDSINGIFSDVYYVIDALLKLDIPTDLLEQTILQLIESMNGRDLTHDMGSKRRQVVVTLLQQLSRKPFFSDKIRECVPPFLLGCLGYNPHDHHLTIAAAKLLSVFTSDQTKAMVCQRLVELFFRPNDTYVTVCYARLLDQFLLPTFETRESIMRTFIQNRSLEYCVETILAFTASLPFEQQIRLASLLELRYGESAILINDCLLGRYPLNGGQTQRQIAEAVEREMPREIVGYVRELGR